MLKLKTFKELIFYKKNNKIQTPHIGIFLFLMLVFSINKFS